MLKSCSFSVVFNWYASCPFFNGPFGPMKLTINLCLNQFNIYVTPLSFFPIRFNTSITLINKTDTLSHSVIKKLHHSFNITLCRTVGCWGVVQLGGFSTRLVPVGTTRFKALKSFLFAEGTPEVEIIASLFSYFTVGSIQ